MQFLLHRCCVTSSKLLTLSVGFLLSICWIAVQPSRHMNHYFLHEDSAVTSVENELFLLFPPFPHLSFMDTCHLSVTVPQMVAVLLEHREALSCSHCVACFLLSIFCGSIACYFLAVAAYDSCVAVCQTLFYVTIVTQKVLLVLWRAYVDGVFGALVMNCFFSQVFVIILPVLPLWCWCNCASLQFIVDLTSFQ